MDEYIPGVGVVCCPNLLDFFWVRGKHQSLRSSSPLVGRIYQGRQRQRFYHGMSRNALNPCCYGSSKVSGAPEAEALYQADGASVLSRLTRGARIITIGNNGDALTLMDFQYQKRRHDIDRTEPSVPRLSFRHLNSAMVLAPLA